MALVEELGGDMIAMGRYDRLPEAPDEAEVAFVVADAHQGRRIGTILLEHLAAIACHDVPSQARWTSIR